MILIFGYFACVSELGEPHGADVGVVGVWLVSGETLLQWKTLLISEPL